MSTSGHGGYSDMAWPSMTAQERWKARAEIAEAEIARLTAERDEAVGLLREAAWLHGMIEPPHPDYTADQHEEREEEWIRDRVYPWLILNGATREPFVVGEFAIGTFLARVGEPK